MVKELILAELKKRAVKLIVIKLLPIFGAITLLILLVAAIVESLSNIPVVGQALVTEFVGEDDLVELTDFGVINYDKVSVYLALEKDSHPENLMVDALVYQSVVTEKSSEFLTPDPSMTIDHKELVPFNLGDETASYRLWWQAVGAFDVAAGTASDLSHMDHVQAFADALSPVFDYSFNQATMADFAYHDTIYSATYTRVKVYRDGLLSDDSRYQINRTMKVPMPYLEAVSTMFSDITYTYTPVILSETDWEVINDESVTTYDYEEEATGAYVLVDGIYALRTADNAKSKEAGYYKDEDGDKVRQWVSGTYVYSAYDPVVHMGMQRYSYQMAKYRRRYRQVEVITKTTTEQRLKREGYTYSTSRVDNHRFSNFMATYEAGGYSASKDKRLLVEFAGLFPGAFEFLYHAKNALGYQGGAMMTGGYGGSGNYLVKAVTSKYLVPVLFDQGMESPCLWVTSTYGLGNLTMNGITSQRFHGGIDFGLPVGTPILAPADGFVSFVGYGPKAGNYLVIDHEDGYKTRFLHLSQSLVAIGDEVTKGKVIAVSGNTGRSTGPHLHFEVIDPEGETKNPLDYLPLAPK